ncbi:collagen-like protein [Streptomyces phytophilus]|uniref:collagen-like protein n=1 Tax=Streptomyces phytophilus TaxID=722715 RepID=UPI001C6876DF|nr:collagen-like protein [Streptomyces phytophilus]
MSGHVSRDQMHRRKDIAFAVAVLVSIGLFMLLVVWVQNLAGDLRQSNEDRDALARQVERLGGTPVAGDPGRAGERGEPGAAGSDGAAGPEGERGEAGAEGEPGAAGKGGADGQDGQPGDPGTPGEDGTPGAAGANGADGATGPTGAQGPQGEKGATGEQGPRGEQGPSGPAPASWTFVFGGVTYTCTPSAEGSTHYTCAADGPPADDGPGNGQGPLALALDPNRRQYG